MSDECSRCGGIGFYQKEWGRSLVPISCPDCNPIMDKQDLHMQFMQGSSVEKETSLQPYFLTQEQTQTAANKVLNDFLLECTACDGTPISEEQWQHLIPRIAKALREASHPETTIDRIQSASKQVFA